MPDDCIYFAPVRNTVTQIPGIRQERCRPSINDSLLQITTVFLMKMSISIPQGHRADPPEKTSACAGMWPLPQLAAAPEARRPAGMGTSGRGRQAGQQASEGSEGRQVPPGAEARPGRPLRPSSLSSAALRPRFLPRTGTPWHPAPKGDLRPGRARRSPCVCCVVSPA